MKSLTALFLLLLSGLGLMAQDYCVPGTTCDGLPCPFVQVRPGRSGTWDANKPINLADHFQIQYLPPTITPTSSSIIWYITAGSQTQTIRGDDPRITAFSFASSPVTTNQWGRVSVGISYRCISNNRVLLSNDAPIEVLDYGIYFFNNSGSKWKFSSGRAASMTGYLDPAKPTIIFTHGWNRGSVASRTREDLLDNTGASMVQYWTSKGWNVGIYYWNQFADEDDVKDAEKKMYNKSLPATNNKFRWRRSNGSFEENNTPDSNIAKLFLADYYALKSFLVGRSSRAEVRLAGHSLGSQLILNAMAGATPNSFLPNRMALLDPWWSLDVQPALSAAMVSLKDKNMPFEWYSSSKIQTYTSLLTNIKTNAGDLVNGLSKGKSNLAVSTISNLLDGFYQQLDYTNMLFSSVVVYLTPTYDPSITSINPVQSLTNQHRAAVWYYFTSINSDPPAEAHGVVSGADIRNKTYDDLDETNTLPFFYTEGDGISASTNTNDLVNKRAWTYTQIKGRSVLAAGSHVQLARWTGIRVPLNRTALPFPQNELNQTATSGNGIPTAPNPRDDFRRVGAPVFLQGRAPASWQPKIARSFNNVNGQIWDSYYSAYNCNTLQPAFLTYHLSQNWRGGITNKTGRRRFIASQTCASKTVHDDYNGSGMDRGHLLARSDRSFSKEENDTTFLMENVAPHNPQQNQFNAWHKFEEYLSDYLIGNSLRPPSALPSEVFGYNLEAWVVAGGSPQGYVTTDSASTGVNKRITSISPENKTYSIFVPTHLWKVVLLHKPGTPFNAQNCAMIGIWLPNRGTALGSWDNPVNNYQYILTVDEIESRTGIDFFNALPGDAGRSLENFLEGRRFDPRNFVKLNGTVSPNSGPGNRLAVAPNGRVPDFPDWIEDKACKQLVLEEGFKAPYGIRYRAFIDPTMCTAAPLRIGAPEKAPVTEVTNGLQLAPNPASTQITVRLDRSGKEPAGNTSVMILDMRGRVLMSRSIQVLPGMNQTQFDISRLSSGSYLVQVRYANGELKTSKFVKQ